MSIASVHTGTVLEEFDLAIRGQVVTFRRDQVIEADDAMRRLIETSGDAVAWDAVEALEAEEPAAEEGAADDSEATPASDTGDFALSVDADATPLPKRRGRPPKVV